MANRVQLDRQAPEFSLADANGQQFNLSDFKYKSNVLLIFNRGFL